MVYDRGSAAEKWEKQESSGEMRSSVIWADPVRTEFRRNIISFLDPTVSTLFQLFFIARYLILVNWCTWKQGNKVLSTENLFEATSNNSLMSDLVSLLITILPARAWLHFSFSCQTIILITQENTADWSKCPRWVFLLVTHSTQFLWFVITRCEEGVMWSRQCGGVFDLVLSDLNPKARSVFSTLFCLLFDLFSSVSSQSCYICWSSKFIKLNPLVCN